MRSEFPFGPDDYERIKEFLFNARPNPNEPIWPSWEGLTPGFPISAVIYTLSQSQTQPRTARELVEETARNFGRSFRLYDDTSPSEGYVRAAIKAHVGGYIRRDSNGYVTTPKGQEVLQGMQEAKQLWNEIRRTH